MNLHSEVRGAISAINPDIAATYRASTGYTTGADYARTPLYVDSAVTVQLQSLSWGDLQHRDMQNVQGVQRAVYMWGDAQGVVRPDVKGGDLLILPQRLNAPAQTWLVVAVLETWTPDALGFCKLGIALQGTS